MTEQCVHCIGALGDEVVGDLGGDQDGSKDIKVYRTTILSNES